MNSKVISILLLQLATNCASDSKAYQTDYDKLEILRLFKEGVKLSFGKLFIGSDVYGLLKEEVTFWCINRDTNESIQTFIDDSDIETKLDVAKPTYFIIHGWLDNGNRTWVNNLQNDLLIYFDVNVCVVDWNKLANYEYTYAALEHVYTVGGFVADFLKYLVGVGVKLETVSLVGNSLGAHVAGHAGMVLGGEVGVIYGLDPAGPYFCGPIPLDQDLRLDASDAKFVQIIHTTDGYTGCSTDSGHQDFRPDGGIVPQSACLKPKLTSSLSPKIIVCSHLQATQYFRYSLNPRNSFEGQRCNSLALYDLQFCSRNPSDSFGPYTKRLGGRFYMNTRLFPPYSPSRGGIIGTFFKKNN